MGDNQHVGLHARLDEPGPSQAHLVNHQENSDCLVIFINQIRMKIGVMFGSPGNHYRR